MNHKENFKDKFLELMAQQVTLEDPKEQRDENLTQVKEEPSISNGDIQELLKQKLKEKLKEKSGEEEVNDESTILPKSKNEISFSASVMESEKMIPLGPALEEISVIMKDTSIIGTIKTRGHVEIFGEVQGNISAAGDIKILGNVKGDLDSLDTAHIGENAIVQGNLSAEQMMIDGNVVGDLRATKKIQLLKNAKVKGTLVTDDFVVSQGAKISGMVKAGETEVR